MHCLKTGSAKLLMLVLGKESVNDRRDLEKVTMIAFLQSFLAIPSGWLRKRAENIFSLSNKSSICPLLLQSTSFLAIDVGQERLPAKCTKDKMKTTITTKCCFSMLIYAYLALPSWSCLLELLTDNKFCIQ